VTADDEAIDFASNRYLEAEMTPAEFEVFAADFLENGASAVEDVVVTLHERITVPDGNYDFDATIRFKLAGMEFLVVAEAKRHNHPIKRDIVAVLHQKLRSVGAHKGILISTAPFQKGALTFAKTHGIALVKVTEGRFTYETKAAGEQSYMSREEAEARLGIPAFVGISIERGDDGSTQMGAISYRDAQWFAKSILGVDVISSDDGTL